MKLVCKNYMPYAISYQNQTLNCHQMTKSSAQTDFLSLHTSNSWRGTPIFTTGLTPFTKFKLLEMPYCICNISHIVRKGATDWVPLLEWINQKTCRDFLPINQCTLCHLHLIFTTTGHINLFAVLESYKEIE